MAEQITVVGAGVVGLTCAHELAAAGHRVRVVADQRPAQTVSAVAAAIWEPYDVAPADQALRWSMTSLAAFTALAGDPDTGVVLRSGTVVAHTASPDELWWAEHIPTRPAEVEELPPGAASGTVCTVPVIVMPRYLAWLLNRCEQRGVTFEWRGVDSLDSLDGTGPVVVACGLRSGALTGDDTLVPARGQVVRVANPGLTHWYIDDENPAGLTYVIPRLDDVICGGTNTPGGSNITPDPAVTQEILRRAIAVEPRLDGAQILDTLVGLRPTRPTVALDHIDVGSRPVISCYGHGGAGVTTSWGAAADVADLIAHL
ncbi:FAD-binding oxidoreductase [Gordonia sp. TBRC 11910]|uniref:D-amino-acid oxidase n=1 Tax=Gordonia asplenii TaxID=2725283 RepID=A0A848L4D0_9ACTN|nr:FAD-dependent oxidoreductase [Gordonia asplenii]NMO02478.1 FAD-binding oxidoreductase [Gordonia asplenii]